MLAVGDTCISSWDLAGRPYALARESGTYRRALEGGLLHKREAGPDGPRVRCTLSAAEGEPIVEAARREAQAALDTGLGDLEAVACPTHVIALDAAALRHDRGRVLDVGRREALQPDRAFRSGELIQLARSGTGATHRQLARLEAVGLVEPLRVALQTHSKAIGAAFVFGSVAKGTDKAGSDVDLLVMCETLGYADLFESLQKAETNLGRKINPTLLTPAAWRTDSLAARVAAQPKLFVIGSEDDLR